MAHNPIQYAINHIRNTIPREILEKVFFSNKYWRTKDATSLDHRIREEVIDARVTVDCNLVGGMQTTIYIQPGWMEWIDPMIAIARIPKEATQGRSITRALSISYGASVVAPAQGSYGGSVLLSKANNVLQSNSPVTVVATAEVNLVGENMIQIRDNVAISGTLYLRCWLEHDANFNHLAKPSWMNFAKLCEYACKAYVYNNTIIDMDRAYVDGGVELGRWASKIEEYSDAEENYQDYFHEKWKQVSVLNDPEAHRRHISMTVGGLW